MRGLGLGFREGLGFGDEGLGRDKGSGFQKPKTLKPKVVRPLTPSADHITVLDCILCYTIPYYTILYSTIRFLFETLRYYTILYDTLRYYTILYDTILYCTLVYYTIPYHTIISGKSPKGTCLLAGHASVHLHVLPGHPRQQVQSILPPGGLRGSRSV